jgi:hypothetical protein
MLNKVPPPFALSAAGASASSGTVVFSNSNGVTFGQNGSTITASVVAAGGNFSAGVSTAGNTAGSTGVTGTRMVLVGTQNITLSQSTDANGATVSISGGAGAAGNTGFISAGGATASLGTVAFSNSNGVSFGVNGQTVTASVATSLTNFRLSAGTTSNLLSAVTFSNSNGVSFGLNASTVTASVATSLTNVNVSAGTTSNNLSAVTFSNSNGVSFGLNGSTVTASVATSLTNFRVSAGTTSNLLSAITFADSNGISFGLNASTVTASYTVPTVTNSSLTLSDNATSMTIGRLAFTNSNGLTLTLSTTTGGSATLVGSYTVPTVPAQLSAGVSTGGNTAGDTGLFTGRVVLAGGNNVTLSGSSNGGSVTYTISAFNQSNQSLGVYHVGNTTGQSSSSTYDARSLSIDGAGIVSVGWSNSSIRISATQSNQAFSAAGGSSAFQTLGFSDNAAASFTNTNGSVAVASVRASIYATSNTTQSSSGTQNLNSLIFAGAGAASVGVTNGSVVISAPNAAAGNVTFSAGTSSAGLASLVFSDSNGVSFGLNGSTITATVAAGGFSAGVSTGGNTAGSTGVTGTRLVFAGTGVVSLSQSTNTAGATLSIGVPATSSLSAEGLVTIQTDVSTIRVGASLPVISSYENVVPFASNITQSLNPQSLSIAVAFNLPQPISASFIRIPVALTTGSTTLSTAAASASMSAEVYSTWNAVVYSLGSGASSKSLQSVASGSGGWTVQNSQSVAANGTQGSYTQAMTYQVEGNTSQASTQYSISNTNYSWVSTNWQSQFTGSRFIDIPFANSLSQGAYWLVFGLSTSTASNSARISAAANCRVGYASHYGASQANLNFGVMGQTNLTSGGLLGAGSFSTAGGGTTAGIPISAISSSASNLRPYFQMLRSN